jgi:hypothetical protein
MKFLDMNKHIIKQKKNFRFGSLTFQYFTLEKSHRKKKDKIYYLKLNLSLSKNDLEM